MYEGALTKGKVYEVLEHNLELNQVKIKGDNNRIRWYPVDCFKFGSVSVTRVKSVKIDDEIEEQLCAYTEVTITMSIGEQELKRWCYFLTPDYAKKWFVDRTNFKPMLLGKHGMILPILTYESITKAIEYLENHNLIEEHSLPLE
uniref:Uncharacterized protein n=2 Tax=Tolypothrix TaxID=111782 RepID=A0A0C1RPB9_9CYAN